MAPFMENIFTFHDRQDAHLHASFRSEDYIWGQVPKPIVKGSRMQHCFNLIGLEYGFNAEKKTGTYYYRQTAAYFSLDLVSVQTVWLIIKGDRAIRESIQDFTEQLDPDIKQNSPEKAFLFALQLHLLIYEWAIQTWTPYIDSLQAKYVDISKVVAYTPVAKKTENAIIDQSVSRSISFNSNVLQAYRPRKRREMSWNKIVKRLGERTSKSPSSSTTPDTSQNLHPDISHTFSFDKLQMLHHEATKVQVGLSVLDQNKTVLQDMLKRFERLHQSEIFLQHVNIKQEEFQTFFHKTEHCIGELDHQHKRLSAIQEDLTGVISLVSFHTYILIEVTCFLTQLLQFNGILQHYNTRIADSYARAAKVSTDSMRWLAVKTKQETVSIHIITILTLFFLPATFVAVSTSISHLYYYSLARILTGCQTFFGSGVIDFEQGSEESKDRWGYWDVRWGALKFFGVFIGPLTGVVLAVWAVTYFKSWRRWRVTMDQNQMQGNGADV